MIQNKIKWARGKVSSGNVIYDKEGFKFYILNGLKTLKNWNGNLSVKKGGKRLEYWLIDYVKKLAIYIYS